MKKYDGSKTFNLLASIKEFVEGKIEQAIPASILKMHLHLTVSIDKEAASLLSNVIQKAKLKE